MSNATNAKLNIRMYTLLGKTFQAALIETEKIEYYKIGGGERRRAYTRKAIRANAASQVVFALACSMQQHQSHLMLRGDNSEHRESLAEPFRKFFPHTEAGVPDEIADAIIASEVEAMFE